MELAITYAAGWLVATIITICKLWKSDILNTENDMKPLEEKSLKILFSILLGLMSWLLVAVYVLMWIYKREELEDHSNITNIDDLWNHKN